jgi:hypothetical protein
MNLRTLIQTASLCVALALALPLQAKDSGDCDVPIELGKKPEMSDHSQLNAFIAAALEYKAQQRKQDQHRKSCPELYLRPPTVWIDDPTVTQGPETLESAVDRSDSFPSLNYGTTDEWYGRTTSQSFALADINAEQLADSLVQTSLATLDQGNLDGQDALSLEQQQAILVLSGVMPNTEDGHLGQDITLGQLTQNLFFTDQSIPFILAGGSNTALVSPSGSTSFYDPEGTLLLFDAGLSESESCLSSCGQFSMNMTID